MTVERVILRPLWLPLLLLPVLGCDGQRPELVALKKEASEAAQAAQVLALAIRDDLLSLSEEHLEGSRDRMAMLAARAEEAGSASQAQFGVLLKDLKARMAGVDLELVRLQVAGVDAWEEVAKGLQQSIDALDAAIARAEIRLLEG